MHQYQFPDDKKLSINLLHCYELKAMCSRLTVWAIMEPVYITKDT